MAERSARIRLVYEGAAARYRALMVKTRDPARRRMLEDMIARELEMRREIFAAPVSRRRPGGVETA
jgi:hypothetical protein